MKSARETLGPTRVKLTVEVPYEELKPDLDAAYQAIGSQIQVPGFRRGKVPSRIIDQRVGRGAVLQEAVNEALPRFYGQALQEHDVQPLGQPQVDVTSVPVEDGQALQFSAEVDCRPEITVPDFSGLAVTVQPVQVPEEAVDERLHSLRERFGTLRPVERAVQDGDFVTIDLSAEIDGEVVDTVTGVSYEVGSGNMLDGLDEALSGLSGGESRTFTAALAGGERAGESAECTVTVEAVKERELPALDDAFAQLASEFDTLEELRADAAQEVERMARLAQGVEARDKLLEAVLASVDVPVPDSVVEEQVTEHLEGENRLDDSEHRAEVQESTREAVRTQLLLDAIVDKEQIQVDQGELIEYLVMTAQQYGMEPAQLAQAVDSQNQIPAMIAEVARRKALATILEQATVTDTDGNPVDLQALSGPPPGEETDAAEEQPDAEEAEADAADGQADTLDVASDVGEEDQAGQQAADAVEVADVGEEALEEAPAGDAAEAVTGEGSAEGATPEPGAERA